jgi:cell division initiation protein
VRASDVAFASHAEEVRNVAFPVALRGYDRDAVDAYVQRVSRLVGELEASGSPEEAVRRALDQVGEETSGILQRAQETASEVTARSRAQADDRLREAEREAAAVTAEAEQRLHELDADFGRLWDQRDRLVDEVRQLAERLLAVADDAADRWAPQHDEEEHDAQAPGDETASMVAVADDDARPGDAQPSLRAGPSGAPAGGFEGGPVDAGSDDLDFGEVYDHESDFSDRPHASSSPEPAPGAPLGERAESPPSEVPAASDADADADGSPAGEAGPAP